MHSRQTEFGQVMVGAKHELFSKAVELAQTRFAASHADVFTWALTGGSTPAAWYQWCVKQRAIPSELLAAAHWFVSDERCVPVESAESNFGNATRMLLDPLRVPIAQRNPWRTDLTPQEAALNYERNGASNFQCGDAFEVCFLGLGDDAHTASLFPGSPLLADALSDPEAQNYFAAVEVPGRGWRLTITPAGLADCGLIVVMALGAAKADAVARIFGGAYDPISIPAQILKNNSANVVWLLDDEAAAGIKIPR